MCVREKRERLVDLSVWFQPVKPIKTAVATDCWNYKHRKCNVLFKA